MLESMVGVMLAKLLSIAGIGGFIAGLLTRNIFLALVVGAALGILDTVVLASARPTGASSLSWIMAIVVAMLMAALGWQVRRRRSANTKA